ncbi:hypothetical protein [Ruminococcus flavefaciens]|uniref:hypothetical protein n=1 Tax=Ruminococcus flavefaciens TaxID=1265 RepID=UPI00048C54D8|nr:hypothetical protein [Ruminococcus flavefaciens]
MSAKAFDALSKSSVVSSNPQTAQSQVNQDDEDRKKLLAIRKRNLIRFGSLAVLAFVVWLFATIAWFTSNKDVGGSGMGVKVEAGSYELRFRGDNIGALSYTAGTPVDGVTPYTSTDIYRKVTPTSDYAYNLPDGTRQNIEGTNYYDTDGGHPKVILRLDMDQLDSNYSGSDYLAPDKEKGLNPGAEGIIQFWVVPKKSGTLTAKFSLNINGYTAVQSDSAPFDVTSLTLIPASQPPLGDSSTEAEREAYDKKAAEIQAVEFLRAHILFFKGEYVNEGTEEEPDYKWVYTDFMNDDLLDPQNAGLYTFTFENAVQGEPIEVRIRWVWSNTFKQMVLSGDANAPAVTIDYTVRAAIQKYAYEHYNNIFKDVNLATVQSKMMKLKDGSETEYEFDAATLNTGTNLDDLSRGYNRADSEVGKRVRYMLLMLGAE